jgi:hypothetical protein
VNPGLDYKAVLIFLKKRPDYSVIVECISEDGSTWREVVECVISKGATASISNIKYRINQLVRYGVVEQHRIGRNTFLVLSNEFLKAWKKETTQEHKGKKTATQGPPEKKP